MRASLGRSCNDLKTPPPPPSFARPPGAALIDDDARALLLEGCQGPYLEIAPKSDSNSLRRWQVLTTVLDYTSARQDVTEWLLIDLPSSNLDCKQTSVPPS